MTTNTKTNGPLIIAIALLVLPMLYVASYLSLVVPAGVPYGEFWCFSDKGIIFSSYRFGKEWPEWFYCPLEKIDRQLRPAAWSDEGNLGIEFEE